MRRILRKIAGGSTDKADFGDTSTLADPAVVEKLMVQFNAAKASISTK
jgi:acetyl-CoA synthetase